jgi:hypothetical protein
VAFFAHQIFGIIGFQIKIERSFYWLELLQI